MKERKKILIVSRSFYPQNSPRSLRTTELAKEFSRQGHAVTVLTPKDNNVHEQFERENRLTIKNMGRPRWKTPSFGKSKIGYLLTRIFVRLLHLTIEYPDIELMFMVKKALRKESGYDMLISVAVPYPIHWGVAKVWNKKQKIAETWVADCGDPYMGDKSDTFRKLFYFKYVEQFFLKKADYITVPIEEAIKAYYKEYRHKFRVIPQGLSFPKIQNEKNQNSVPTFIYSGAITPYMHYALPFFEFIKTLKTDFCFKVYTRSPELFISNLGPIIDKININSYIKRENLLQELSNADFLLHFPYKENSQRSLKLIDYWFSRRPVLSFDNQEACKKLFLEFLKGDYSNQDDIPAIDEFRIENVCKSFLKLSDAK